VYFFDVHLGAEELMLEISVKEARTRLSALLDRVERGEEIVITRRGRKIARLVPTGRQEGLPSLKDFRAGIQASGEPLSRTVIVQRDEERY
jgi:prevent-host-death family protein